MILSVVQARMSSTRLPGKVMKKILGKPLIGYLLERLKLCSQIQKIVVATTHQASDESLCDYVRAEGFDVFRGNEEDVLNRFYYATLKYRPKAIVRITADCPLIDPSVVDNAVSVFLKTKVDYVHTGPTFAEGVDCEVFSFKALKRANKEAHLKSEREHVTLYFRHQPKLFGKITIENRTDDSRYRWVVDQQEDFAVVQAIIEYQQKVQKNISLMTTDEIKHFLDTHRQVYELNAHVLRNEGLIKSLAEDQNQQMKGKDFSNGV